MSKQLLLPEGIAALERFISPETLFAFDLDGTLAPIIEDYAAVQITEPVRDSLEQLAKCAKVAVITGRSRQIALSILGFEPHLVVGNHGAEWPPDSDRRNRQEVAVCLKWKEHLNSLLNCVKGVEIEFKGESVSLHYRKANNPEKVLELIDAAIGKLVPGPRRIGGKFVVNLLPMEALTKGQALLAAMDMFGLKRAVFVGDDLTDEEVFKLKNPAVFGIHVGNVGRTAASYYLDEQPEVVGLINRMVGVLKSVPVYTAKSCHDFA